MHIPKVLERKLPKHMIDDYRVVAWSDGTATRVLERIKRAVVDTLVTITVLTAVVVGVLYISNQYWSA